jgi:hypothetical protein
LCATPNQQAEILEGDILAEEGVGADDDVHGAVAEPFLDGLLLLRGAIAREQLDAGREGGKAIGEG